MSSRLYRRWQNGIPAMLVVGLTIGMLAQLMLPQRPDGDTATLALYRDNEHAAPIIARLGLLDVDDAFWYNLSGALLAVWIIDRLLRRRARREQRDTGRLVMLIGGLVWCAGWGWTQTTGWHGELFMRNGRAVGLGPAHTPTLEFERFTVPPAPDGPGRALTMRLSVDGRPYTARADAPLRTRGWIIRPHWYGGLVHLPDGTGLHFGLDGTQRTTLADGRTVEVTLDIETLAVQTEPPIAVEVERFAVISAVFDPGRWLRRLGLVGVVLGGGWWLWKTSSILDMSV